MTFTLILKCPLTSTSIKLVLQSLVIATLGDVMDNHLAPSTSSLNALNCVKTHELFKPQDKNYDSIDFTLTYTKCGKE